MTTIDIAAPPPRRIPMGNDRSQEEGGPEKMGDPTTGLQPVNPAPEAPLSGAGLLQTKSADPFHEAFDTSKGRVDVAAGGPFAETLRLLAPEVSSVVHSSDPALVAAQAEKLTAMGHSGELPKYAVNINTDNLTDPNQFNAIVHNVAAALGGSDPNGAVQAARRGKRTNQQTIDAAIASFRNDEGFVLGRVPGQAANAEQVTATRLVMATLRDKTTELAKRVVAGEGSPEVLIGFRRSLSEMAAFQLQLHGMAAEAGRALQAFRIQTQPGLLDLVRGADGMPAALPQPSAGAAATPSPSAMPNAAAPAPGPLAQPEAAPLGQPTAAPAAGAAANATPPATAPQQMPAAAAQANAGAQAAQTQNVIQLLNSQGGQQGLTQLAQAFLQLPTPAAQNAMARASATRGVADMLGEVFYNFVLSGPATHAVNMTGNVITIANATQERAVAAMWGKLFGFVGAQEGVKMSESAALIQGYWGALGDAWKLAHFAMKTGDSVGPNTGYRMPMSHRQIWGMTQQQAAQLAPNTNKAGMSKVANGKEPAITGPNVLNIVPDTANRISQHIVGRNVMNPVVLGQRGVLGRATDYLSSMVDVTGSVLRTPTRALGAEDQFFKTIAFRGEARARAYREGINSGLSGTNLDAYVDNAVNFMLPADDAAAEKFARNVTMSESLISNFSRGINQAGNSKFGYLFAPFVRVTANILDYSTQRVAFPARPAWWAEVTSQDPAVRDLAMAKASTGAMMWMGAMAAASTMLDADEDAPIVVTGAQPSNPQQASIWRKRGFHEYSVRLGGKTGKWVQYNRLDPGGQMLGIAADSVNIMARMKDEDASEFGTALIAGIGNNVVNKNYMQSIAESMEVFTSYDVEQWQKWVQGRAASFVVPNIVQQYVSAQDPYLRRAVNIAEEITKRSSVEERMNLPMSRDIAGYPVKQEWLFGTRFTGLQVYDGKVDPVADELQRLQMKFSAPSKNMRGVELDEKQYDTYAMLAGHGLKMRNHDMFVGPAVFKDGKRSVVKLELKGLGMWEALGALMKDPLYKAATDGADPPGQKVQMISEIQDRYKKAAQDRVLANYPELIDKVMDFDSKAKLAKGLPADVEEKTRSFKRMTLQKAVDNSKDYEVVE